MNYSHIELILAVADAGSISVAANNLFVSTPFLSHALKQAEEEIGTPLFRRSKSGTELTPFGHEYVNYARHIASEIDTLNKLYRSRQVDQLRLDIINVGLHCMLSFFDTIREKYHRFPCAFHLAEGSVSQQIEEVRAGRYEAGIAVVDEFTRKQVMHRIRIHDLEYFKLQDACSGIYVSPKSPTIPPEVRQLDNESIRYLSDMPYISLYDNPDELHFCEYWPALDSLVKNRDTRIIAGSNGLRIDMINRYNGFGTAAYCPPLYSRAPFPDQLRFIPFAPEVSYKLEIGWIQRQNQPRSTLANELLLLLK